MKLEFSIFAHAADISKDGLLGMLGGGVDFIKSKRFPTGPNFLHLVVRIHAALDECKKPSVLRIDITGPTHTTKLPEHRFAVEPHPRKPERGGYAVFIIHLAGVTFNSPGDFTFRFHVDDETVGEAVLEVIQADGGPSEASSDVPSSDQPERG